jgi:hypothetical protein
MSTPSLKTNGLSQSVVLSVLPSLLGLSLPACGLGTDGNGTRSVESRPEQDFTAVDNRDALDLKVEQGDTFSLVVSIDSNLQSLVRTRVDADTLVVDVSGPVGDTVAGPHVIVTMPVLRAATLSGSGGLSAESFSQDDAVDLVVAGSGNLVFSGDVPAVTGRLTGSGDMSLRGTADAVDLGLDGSGNVAARDLTAATGDISLEGSGNVAATVTGPARLTLGGSGDIDLYGGGTIERASVTGSGTVRMH